jgi:hypothetical protein
MMLKQLQQHIKEFFRDDNIVSIEEELKAIRQRNEARAKAAIEAMGEKWIAHPSHSAQRIKQ